MEILGLDMYSIYSSNKKVEKKINYYLSSRNDIIEKIKELRENPRRACDAH